MMTETIVLGVLTYAMVAGFIILVSGKKGLKSFHRTVRVCLGRFFLWLGRRIHP